jgi:hemerythrin-like domain-containing protein
MFMQGARKTESFLHFDTPAGYDDPIGMLLGCHRRIEKKLATLKALAAHLASKGIDAEATVAAQGVLRYFSAAAIHHHDDEEKDLFPLLAQRVSNPAERENLIALETLMCEEHAEIEKIWGRLRKSLEGIAEGFMRPLSQTDVQALATLYKRHIAAEEKGMLPLMERCLTEADLRALGRAMAQRRGAPFSG